ncbi:MAG: hypothetical protein NE334_13850 [Lentisphaeraceae bacterium]|nr:hypothetical protein [Lentisphaeraceae bacterium]
MIKRIEIHFDEDPDSKPLALDFDFSITNTIYVDDAPEELVKESWVQLDNNKCSQCTLKNENHPACPVALNLGKYAHELFHRQSTDTVSIQLWEESGRHLQLANIPLQDVTGELVRMAVFQSECPIGRRVKKALEFVPPFPTDGETTRAFALFFAMQQLQQTGRDVTKEQIIYLDSLHELFENLSRRVRAITRGDAGVNGVMIYHSLMMLVSLSLPENLEKVMKEYTNW